MQNLKDIVVKTLNENTTILGNGTGIFGALTVSEWCILISVVVTILGFIKNSYFDCKRLKILQEHLNKEGGCDEFKK